MTIYNFNLLLGYEPNGVDVAQASRAQLFYELGEPALFLFTRLPNRAQIRYFLSLGHKEENLLLAHLALTSIKTSRPSLSVQAIAARLGLLSCSAIDQEKDRVVYHSKEHEEVIFYLEPDSDGLVYQVDYFSMGYIVKREHYSYTKMYTEYFTAVNTPWGLEAVTSRRVFYHEDGTLAYEILFQKEQEYYRFGLETIEGPYQFMQKVIAALPIKSDDVILLDRAAQFEFVQPLLEARLPAKIGLVLHSEHAYGEEDRLDYGYYYALKYVEEFSFFITATDLQADLLGKKIKQETDLERPVYAIPVGHLESRTYPDSSRQAYSVMTASRLDPRKRIDLAVRAVALAHATLPKLTFHIFGQGSQASELAELIASLDAQDYILLRGHSDLQQEYSKHQLYLTTSMWETFGLTLMEAVGSGLGMIGFELRYGNLTFIKEGENGYLVPFQAEDEAATVATLAEKIVTFFQEDLEVFQQKSYQIAQPFLKEAVKEDWRRLLKQLC